jgi:alpha-beta hydrolase superfamily lysophospholipase
MSTTASPTPFPASLRTRDGLKLVTQHWPLPSGQPRGVAVIVHGLGEHALRYVPVAQALQAQGLAVVALDHRGHGRSEGPRGRMHADDDLLHDLALLIDAARAAYPGLPVLLLGHSLGGVLAARFAAELARPEAQRATWSRPLHALMLSSPALALRLNPIQKLLMATVARWLPDLAVANGLKPEWVCHNPDTVAAYIADPLVHDRISGRLSLFMLAAGELSRGLAGRWPLPTLILWGGDDRCVAPQGSADFLAAARAGGQAGTAKRVEGQCFAHLSHEIFLEREQAQVLGVLGDWVGRVFGG